MQLEDLIKQDKKILTLKVGDFIPIYGIYRYIKRTWQSTYDEREESHWVGKMMLLGVYNGLLGIPVGAIINSLYNLQR